MNVNRKGVEMKKPWEKILCGIFVFFFSFALFCCSICNLAQASVNSAHPAQHVSILASTITQHSCCPSSSANDHRCPDSNFSLALLPDQFVDLGKSNILNFSKSTFHGSQVPRDLPNFVLAGNILQFPLQLLQKSTSIYLFDRVLRL